MNSAAENYAHLTQTRSNDFQHAWNCLISRVVVRDNDGVKQWCDVWGNMPQAIRTQLMEDKIGPMCIAAEGGSVDIIEILVKYGFHPNRQDRDGNQLERFVPIHTAAKNGHLDVVKKLVEDFSVPVDTRNSLGYTPLMWAVKSNHTSIVQYLLTKGADANCICHDPISIDLSPLVLSVINRSKDNACLLLDSGADVSLRISNTGSVLNVAVIRGYLDMVKLLYNRGAKLDVLNEQGQGIMHLALGPRPNVSLIRYLIELNVSLDIVSDDGYSPLCYGLSSAADCEVVLEWAPLLLDAGHQLSRQDYNSVRDLITFCSDQLEKIDGMVEKYLSAPRTLQQLCCFRIRRLLGKGVRLPGCIENLPLPSTLRGYICLKNLQLPTLTKTQESSEHSQASLNVLLT